MVPYERILHQKWSGDAAEDVGEREITIEAVENGVDTTAMIGSVVLRL